MMEWWNGGMVEWWNDGMVERWNGGMMEWWSSADRHPDIRPPFHRLNIGHWAFDVGC
jgi:hypothetical protein